MAGVLDVEIVRADVAPEDDCKGLWFRWEVAALKALEEEHGEEEQGGEGEGTREVEPVCWQGKTLVSECVSGPIQACGQLSGVELSERFMNVLANADTGLLIEAYVGEDNEVSESELLGSVSIPLGELLTNESGLVEKKLVFRQAPENDEEKETDDQEEQIKELYVVAKISLGDSFKEFCQGSRVLSLVDAPVLYEAPEEWLLIAQSASEESMRFELNQFNLGSGAPIVIDGQVAAAATTTTPQDTVEGEEESENDVMPPKLITWEKTGPSTQIFLLKSSVEDLLMSECKGLSFECTYPKAVEDPKAKVAAEGPVFESCARGVIDLSSLMALNTTESESRCVLTVERVQKESSEESGQEEKEDGDVQDEPQGPISITAECRVRVTPALIQPKPAPKPTLMAPRDIIPCGPPLQVRLQNGEELLSQQVAAIVESIADEYVEVLAEITAEKAAAESRMISPPQSPSTRRRSSSPKPSSPSSRSRSRTPPPAPEVEDPDVRFANVMSRLFFKLNSSGAYSSIRDRLRFAVSKFVSENKAAYSSQGVLSETDVLYSIVYEQVMVLVNRYVNAKFEAAKRGQTSLDAEQGKLPAKEVAKQLAQTLELLLARAQDAATQGSYDEAQEIFLERIAQAERASTSACDRDFLVDPKVYVEYGLFAMSRGREFQGVAADLMRKAIEIDDENPQALVAYAALLLEAGAKADQQIEALLVAAGSLTRGEDSARQEAKLISRGLLGLLETRIAEVQSSFMETLAGSDLSTSVQDESEAEILILTRTAAKCLSWNLTSAAEKLLRRRAELLTTTEFKSVSISKTNRYNSKLLEGWKRWVCGDINAAEDLFEQASEIDGGCPDAWVLIGTSFEGQKFALAKALSCWETEECDEQSHWRARVPESKYRDMLFRLGNIYFGESNFESAKQVFLRLCKMSPTPAAWVGVGVACQCSNDLDSAIEALSQANYMDRENAETWGFLALTCQQKAQQENSEEFAKLAELSMDQTLRLGLQSTHLLHQLGVAFGDSGKMDLARKALQKAVETTDSTPILIDYCRVLLLTNGFEEAKPILQELETKSSQAFADNVHGLKQLSQKLHNF